MDRGHDKVRGDLRVEVEMDPKAMFFKDEVSYPLSAVVCGSCGNVMFSVGMNAASDLRDAVEVMRVAERHGGVKNHPEFKAFVAEDDYRKYLRPKDLARHFAKWLRERESGEG